MRHETSSASNTFDIVARALPYVDRRALSQAWYSTLHIAERDVAPHAAPSTKLAPSPAGARSAASHERRQEHSCGSSRVHAVTLKTPGEGMPAAIEPRERRRPPHVLAARIAKTFEKPAPCTSATFDVEHGGQRVRVLMRCERGDMRLVALCRPALRETVARALDEACFILASRGAGVRSAQTKEVPA